MSHFFCRLNPPRRTFSQDMSAEEAQLMGRHAAYWKQLLDQGRAELFGLVGDPAGGWGFAVAKVDDLNAVRALTSTDPVILAEQGFSYDIFPMPRGAIVR